MEQCSDFRYDLKIGLLGEKLISDIFTNKTLEIKRDSWIFKSDNIAVEFESRGKPSGLSTTKADYWCFIFSGGYNDEVILIIQTERLKKISREYFKTGKIKLMGDNNTSKAILIPIDKLIKYKI